MDAIKDYLTAGELQAAIKHVQDLVRKTPSALDMRACLIELLCLAGDIERADEVLSTLAKHNPDWIPGAANLRQLLRAQQARLALREGKLADDVVATPGPALEALLALNLHLSQGDLAEASKAAAALEASRTPCVVQVGDAVGDIRDCDDSLGGYVEGLGTDGRYYLWQWSEVQSIRLHTPSSPVEMIWRRADFELADGRQGEVFLPLTYAASSTDSQRLGRETDWLEHADGLVTGVGTKTYLVGDTAVVLDGTSVVERQHAEEISNAV